MQGLQSANMVSSTVDQRGRTISMILPLSSVRLNTYLSHLIKGEIQPQVDMIIYGYDSFRILKN